jgi:uncharacterized oxidoreductase
MPIVPADTIERVTFQVLRAAGAPESHAATVAAHLADSNLAGHDSHGLQRLPQYVNAIEKGTLQPRESPIIVEETAAIALLDGRWTFGQVIAKFATELAIQKARDVGVAFVGMYNEGHTGRMGSYPEMAAKAGMVAALWDGCIGGPKANQAPFGGIGRKLGANPIAIGFPSGQGAPMLLDFATSCSAAGKVHVAKARGKRMPDKWLIDASGAPTDDPDAFYNGGALLPMGGLSTGHKGYALGFMVGLFGLLMSMRAGESLPGGNRWGTALMVLDVARFGSLDQFRAEVDEAVNYVKDTPPMEGFSEVLYPGEFEARTRQERLANGVDIPGPTWKEVTACIRKFGLEQQVAPLP